MCVRAGGLQTNQYGEQAHHRERRQKPRKRKHNVHESLKSQITGRSFRNGSGSPLPHCIVIINNNYAVRQGTSAAVTERTARYLAFKRFMDIVFALAGLLAALPVVGLFSILIRLESPGPDTHLTICWDV